MINIVVFGEAMTYPPKDGISAHVYSLLQSLSDSVIVKPILVVSDRGYVTAEQYKSMPWEVYLVPPDCFYDYSYMENLLERIGPDAIQSYDAYQARLIGTRYAAERNIPLVMEHHDVEAVRASFLTLPEGIGEKNAIAQKEVAEFASLNRVMSQYDYQYLKKLIPQSADRFICMPVAIKDDFAAMRDLTRRSKRDILFVGNGGYPPNLRAMHYIVKQLAPCMPNYTFHIAGRHSDEVAAQAGDNVIGYGMVDDLSKLAEKCFCGIAPLESGSGMKIKLLTYASARLPVVATPVALQGYQNVPFFKSAELDEFAEALIDLSDATNHRELSDAARAHYVEHYSPDHQRALLEGYYTEIVARQPESLVPLSLIERDDSRLFWLHEERDEAITTKSLIHYNGAPA